jgi:hypothetical protein
VEVDTALTGLGGHDVAAIHSCNTTARRPGSGSFQKPSLATMVR